MTYGGEFLWIDCIDLVNICPLLLSFFYLKKNETLDIK